MPCTKRPEMGSGTRVRHREKLGLVMRESQCLDTDLNLSRDLIGMRRSISVKRSSILATVSAVSQILYIYLAIIRASSYGMFLYYDCIYLVVNRSIIVSYYSFLNLCNSLD